MKEIKFKTWDRQRKKMREVKQLYFYLDDPFMVSCHDGYFGYIEDFELIQFTGLHDRTGKEIWEGDILQSPDKSSKYEVIFDGGSFIAKKIGSFEWYRESYEMKFDEVIGNIYENIELLGEPPSK